MNDKHNFLEKKANHGRNLILKLLNKIEIGEIIWVDGSTHRLGVPRHHLSAKVTVHNRNFYKKFILRGSLGAAESYINGEWSSDNLTQLMQIILKNEALLNQLDKGWACFGNFFRMFKNMLNYNHIKNSRKNILYHYDLSNDFFQQFLDKQMVYSSAIFGSDLNDLDQAQTRKLQLICEKLKLNPEDHLLEIGSGWGALAFYAARNYRCKVTTTTISDAQYDYVKQKIKELNLTDRVYLLKEDYRNLQSQYDKLVSIEMIESIGFQYFNKYFQVCNRLLKKGGLFLLQSIVINDQAYDRYKHELDFIKAYIFPGGCVPCLHTLSQAVKEKTNMRIKEVTDFGKDYAKTLAHWRKRFKTKSAKIKELGFDERFNRLFDFYFCYCEAGFLTSYISVIHALMEKR